MVRAKKASSIAILIKHAHRWPEALQATKHLQGSGATVTIFILCNEMRDGDRQFDNMMASIKNLNIRCFTDQPSAGMISVPLETMAKILRQFELVIPI